MDENIQKIDLHLHSNESDGLLKPGELIKVAVNNNVRAISITDHDTVKGLKAGSEAASYNNIEFVPGFEISIDDEGEEIHLLGYYPYFMKDLSSILTKYKQERYTRVAIITEKFKKKSINISFSEVLNEAGSAAPGRLHLARLMVQKKYCSNIPQAFNMYLKKGKEFFVPRKLMNIRETMSFFDDIKAIPVIAHPGFYKETVIDKLLSYGLKGIEVFHPEHNSKDQQKYLSLSQQKNLIVTGGTDYHGDGITIPYPVDKTIDYSYLDKLKSFRYK